MTRVFTATKVRPGPFLRDPKRHFIALRDAKGTVLFLDAPSKDDAIFAAAALAIILPRIKRRGIIRRT